jgi:hypothetical protein
MLKFTTVPKKIKMQVGNHENNGVLINHQRRQLAKQTKGKLKKIGYLEDAKFGHDGMKMGAEDE